MLFYAISGLVRCSFLRMLRKHTRVPLVGHFDFIAPFTQIPFFGVHSKLITKLQRLVGFDSIIMPGFGDRMKTPDDEVLDNVQECFKPLGHIKTSFPVPAGSQWAGSIARLHKRLGTIDFGIVPGRGVFGHRAPHGPQRRSRQPETGLGSGSEGCHDRGLCTESSGAESGN